MNTLYSFSLCGGIGDFVHHFTEGQCTRFLPYLRRIPNVKIRAYTYLPNPALTLLLKSGLVDTIQCIPEPVDSGWKPDYYYGYWIEDHCNTIAIENFLKAPLPLPIDTTYGVKYLFGDKSILIHPFTRDIAKVCVDGLWWSALISTLLEDNYVVHLVGSSADWNTPLIDGLQQFIGSCDSPNLINHVDDVPLYRKFSLLKFVNCSLVVDSCWMHAAQHFQLPSLLLQNRTHYRFYFSGLEKIPYDANWFPAIRNKLNGCKDFFDVLWADKYDPLPSLNTLVERLNQLSVRE